MKIFNIVYGLINKAVSNTPVVSSAHAWTTNTATNSKVAREILRMVVYTCVGCMVYTLYMAFQLIMAGKLSAAAGTVIAGAFTLFGGVLTVTIPAFVAALNATDAPPTSVPPSPSSNTAP